MQRFVCKIDAKISYLNPQLGLNKFQEFVADKESVLWTQMEKIFFKKLENTKKCVEKVQGVGRQLGVPVGTLKCQSTLFKCRLAPSSTKAQPYFFLLFGHSSSLFLT